MRGRHEAGSLLVTGQDQFDLRGTQRLHNVEVFFPGDTKNSIYSLILQGGDEKVRSLCHFSILVVEPRH